jgi:23S rRNA (adenine2503-C2)-methyltransferase
MKVLTAKDGTRKLMYSQGYLAVIIPTINEKFAVCVSCQVGCPIGCSFCHTGKFQRNLTADEIVQQVRDSAKEIGKAPTSIVYMGMGEPMTNYKAVRESIDMIHDEFSLSYKKITLSTSCVQLDKLLDVPFQVALSLHSPFDEVRKKLIPGAMPVAKILKFVEEYSATRKFGCMIEYALIRGVNDRDEDVAQLMSYKWPENILFNIIEYNNLGEFVKSDRLIEFKEAIRKAGYKCFIRQSRGADIEAACGMLDVTV